MICEQVATFCNKISQVSFFASMWLFELYFVFISYYMYMSIIIQSSWTTFYFLPGVALLKSDYFQAVLSKCSSFPNAAGLFMLPTKIFCKVNVHLFACFGTFSHGPFLVKHGTLAKLCMICLFLFEFLFLRRWTTSTTSPNFPAMRVITLDSIEINTPATSVTGRHLKMFPSGQYLLFLDNNL